MSDEHTRTVERLAAILWDAHIEGVWSLHRTVAEAEAAGASAELFRTAPAIRARMIDRARAVMNALGLVAVDSALVEAVSTADRDVELEARHRDHHPESLRGAKEAARRAREDLADAVLEQLGRP